MSLKKKLEDHIVVIIAVVFAMGASMGWGTSEHLRVSPIETQLEQFKIQRAQCVKSLDHVHNVIIPRIVKQIDLIPIPEPRQQCEIVELYDQLAVAVRQRDINAIYQMYSEQSMIHERSRELRQSEFKDMLGKEIMFYVSFIRHNDDGTISANTKVFYGPGKQVNRNDKLIYERTVWKFLDTRKQP